MTRPGEYAQILLECFRTALETNPAPPPQEKICLRFGSEVNPQLGTLEDECCTGLAWVRVADVSAIVDPDDQQAGNCPITTARRLTLEIGTARCIPFGTVQAPPSCDTWTEKALQMDADLASIEAALCCFASAVEDLSDEPRVFPGEYAPGGPDGNCISGTMTVIIDYDCGCAG